MSAFREISPAINASVAEYFSTLPPVFQDVVRRIRQEKVNGTRPTPSSSLIDASHLLSSQERRGLLDAVARLVDENLSGRSDMCQHFADLLSRALQHLRFPARLISGTAIYFDAGNQELFRWPHAWVRVGKEVIDGNVDSLFENPVMPNAVKVRPYWGPVSQIPADRRLRENHGATLQSEADVTNIWWPDLKQWLEKNFGSSDHYSII
jgi:hypothetical protein